MHRHACDVGHYYECDDDNCVCICGLPMEGNDHSDCPIEIRLCPEHEHEQDRPAPDPGFVQIDFLSVKPRTTLRRCECGCADLEPDKAVGWCLHCDHAYAEYNPEIEARHFAMHCPDAPDQLKRSARARLASMEAKRRGRNGVGQV